MFRSCALLLFILVNLDDINARSINAYQNGNRKAAIWTHKFWPENDLFGVRADGDRVMRGLKKPPAATSPTSKPPDQPASSPSLRNSDRPFPPESSHASQSVLGAPAPPETSRPPVHLDLNMDSGTRDSKTSGLNQGDLRTSGADQGDSKTSGVEKGDSSVVFEESPPIDEMLYYEELNQE